MEIPKLYQDLPDDDDLALIVFIDRIHKDLVIEADGDATNSSAELCRQRIISFLQIFDVSDELKNSLYLNHEITDYTTSRKFVRSLKLTTEAAYLKSVSNDRLGLLEYVEIEENYKIEIRELVEKIKIRIEKAGIDVDNKDSLFTKLNAFLKELDKNRTRLSALTAAFVQVASAVGDSAEKLEPAIELFERVMKAVGLGSKETPALPKWEEQKKLPAPEQDEPIGEEQKQ